VISALGLCPCAHHHFCAPITGEAQLPGTYLHSLLTRFSICRLSSLTKGERYPDSHHSDPGRLQKHLGTGYHAPHQRRVRRPLSPIARAKLKVCADRW
jgi:hypothetical protein